jgi:hypothetical protein
MSKIRFHGPIAGISGAMGDMVFADREKDGTTIAYMKKKKKGPRSEAQIATTKQLSAGPRYAKRAMASPAKRELYETIAQIKDKPAFILAVMDYFSVPTFEPLDLTEYKGQAGDPILIEAVDDIGLASVGVELIGTNDVLVEQGNAVETRLCSGDWVYMTTTSVAAGAEISIRVTGTDYTGKVVQITEMAVVGA